MIFAKYSFLTVVGVSLVLLMRLAVRPFERKIALCFKAGFTNHYVARKGNRGEGQTEVLLFTFEQLHFASVLFLLLCWIVRVVEPDAALLDLRYPTPASQRKNDALNVCSVWEVWSIDLHADKDFRDIGVFSDRNRNELAEILGEVPQQV